MSATSRLVRSITMTLPEDFPSVCWLFLQQKLDISKLVRGIGGLRPNITPIARQPTPTKRIALFRCWLGFWRRFQAFVHFYFFGAGLDTDVMLLGDQAARVESYVVVSRLQAFESVLAG